MSMYVLYGIVLANRIVPHTVYGIRFRRVARTNQLRTIIMILYPITIDLNLFIINTPTSI